ncbi:MAG: carbon-nitrogen hydrolase family protein [Candidatus Hydrogenedentes bacterium]|nr:carbon-nitrogen hydrolase family protein [Candidatus Hydrogenedentota bacterium]
MTTIRLTGVQMAVSPKLEENLPVILAYIEKSDSDFILFPEMSLTGYHGEFSDKATEQAWRQIAAACRQSYVSALIGTGCRTAEGVFIQTRIYDKSGELVGTHEKLVPTAGDRKFCRPGEELRVFEDNGITFGCLICNDLWVTPGCGPYPDPRLMYQLGQKGAQIVFHSAHSGSSAIHTPFHESNLVLRARESKIYVATANAADPDGPVNSPTGVVSPEGEWLVQCPRQGQHAFTYDVEFDTE